MNLKNNTILITGGSSGVGLELCRQLIQDNTIIICARSLSKLNAVKKELPEVETYSCDLSKKEQRNQFLEWVKKEHSSLNVLINNAALVHKTNFMETSEAIEMAELEINTNFLAPIHLTKELVSVLQKNYRPTIVNITTGLVYCPRADYPFYNATKAALHSFTQVLREQLKQENISIVEVLLPVVDTPWHKGNPPKIAISTPVAVEKMLGELQTAKTEIKLGAVKLLYWLHRIAPKFAFKKINGLNKE
ncbi:SDR family NAD(P)-dependent oxidoreductase [uncultured Maribacter sp.]|uniref:SDR family oxidoreductase n=1 Tax=uncultured Maribacter sp. TaxID=431308 RepID=UPI00260C9298|nr:SDR family NAD(P)-dependent oxidoreductase [uncultured Maribacter sp.]